MIHDREWQDISEDVKNIIETCIKGKDEIYVALHESGDTKYSQKQELESELKDKKVHFSTYHRENDDKIYKEALDLMKGINPTVDEHLKRLKEAIKEAEKKENIKLFSFLKHRIAHCFLSIDLDLQSAKEEGEYLEDILSTKQKGYYTNKLNQARCYAVGGKWCNCTARWGKEQNQSFQPPDNYILDLLGDSPPKEWSTVCTLLGLSESDYSEEIESSPIAKFFKKLEEKREKDSIDEDNVDDILNYFTKHISPNGWHVSEANPSYIKSFHDWCCALDDALDRLRASLLSSNRAKGN